MGSFVRGLPRKAAVACLFVACGGRSELFGSGTVALDAGHDSAIAAQPDAGRDASVVRDATVTADGDGAVCVDIQISAADQACAADSECALVPTGEVCTTYCCGGGDPVNLTAAARIEAQEAILPPSPCPGGCPAGPRPRCLGGSCVSCPPSFEPGPPGCVDASAPDGATCISVDATFPSITCAVPSDCAAVLLGTICSTTCNCEANTAISATYLPSYQSLLGGITLQSCHCRPAQATCAAGQCILCPSPGTPNPPPGC